MTARSPLVIISGVKQQLPAGDSLDIPGFPVVWGSGDVVNTVGTVFIPPGWSNQQARATRDYSVTMTRAGIMKNLRVRHNLAVGNGNTVVYTVTKNSVDTTLTATLATGAIGNASDTTHSFTVVAGDLIDIKAVKGTALGSGGGAISPIVSVELV